MTSVGIFGEEWKLPPRSHFGRNVEHTLGAIVVAADSPIALYSAMGLVGRAKSYGGRYKAAFVNFARSNSDKLVEGPVGPKGGYGFRYVKSSYRAS